MNLINRKFQEPDRLIDGSYYSLKIREEYIKLRKYKYHIEKFSDISIEF